jgi:hypothetical protein
LVQAYVPMAARRTSPSGAAPARAAGASGAVQAALPSPFADLRLNCTGCGSLLCYAYSRSIPANTSIITRATLTAPATVRAGKPASYNPSTKEVLAWVSSHFNVPAEYFRVAKPTKYGDYTGMCGAGRFGCHTQHKPPSTWAGSWPVLRNRARRRSCGLALHFTTTQRSHARAWPCPFTLPKSGFAHPLHANPPITVRADTFKVGKKSVKVRHVRIEQVQSWISSFNPNQDFGALQVEFGYIFVHLDKNTVLAVTGAQHVERMRLRFAG